MKIHKSNQRKFHSFINMELISYSCWWQIYQTIMYQLQIQCKRKECNLRSSPLGHTCKNHNILGAQFLCQRQYLQPDTEPNLVRVQWNKLSQRIVKGVPAGTFSAAPPAWNNFVWWFFCATITINLGMSASPRYR